MRFNPLCILGVCLVFLGQFDLRGASVYRFVGKLAHQRAALSGVRFLHATVKMCDGEKKFIELCKRLRQEQPFAVRQNGHPYTIFEPALSFSDATKQKITHAVMKSEVERTIFFVHNVRDSEGFWPLILPYMSILDCEPARFKAFLPEDCFVPEDCLTILQKGALVSCNDIAKDIFNGANKHYKASLAQEKKGLSYLLGQEKKDQFNEFAETICSLAESFDVSHMLAILYHELGHSYFKHSLLAAKAESEGKSCKQLVDFRRLQEYEADEFVLNKGGVILAKKLQELFQRADDTGFFKTADSLALHPSPKNRIAYLERKIQERAALARK